MFGFTIKKPATTVATDKTRPVGLDLTATRLRGVSVGGGKSRALVLDAAHEELLLFLALDRRNPEPGRAGYSLCRTTPHLVCSNFLAQLGQPRQWQAGRHTVTPETALQAVLEKARSTVSAETASAGLTLPAYLTAAQVKRVWDLATKARLPLIGSVVAPLAIVADRAPWVLGTESAPDPTDSSRPEWVVPIRPQPPGPSSVVVVDADEYALSATIVSVDEHVVRLGASAVWPTASRRLWKDRLIDLLSDRCVRLCRRDPRDSATVEQSLYEQLDTALDRVRVGDTVTLSLRSDHWYQDLVLTPDEFDAGCVGLARIGAEGVRDLLRSGDLPGPPRGVWLTPAASRLPGLAHAIHRNVADETAVQALAPSAVAEAVARMVPRWLTNQLPRSHVDAVIPWAARPTTPTVATPRTSTTTG